MFIFEEKARGGPSQRLRESFYRCLLQVVPKIGEIGRTRANR
jgi:hypothetical protein